MRDGDNHGKELAAGALMNLAAKNEDTKAAVTKAGVFEPIVALMRDGTSVGHAAISFNLH